MSKADELFNKLGYTNMITYKNGVEYSDDENETISLTDYEGDDKRIEYSRFEGITMQELQAINEKVKELKWE